MSINNPWIEIRDACVLLYACTWWPYKGKSCCPLNNTSSVFWSLVSSFSSPSLTLFLSFPVLPQAHSASLSFSLLLHSQSFCSFLHSQHFCSRPLGLVLPLLFSDLRLLLLIKQERCTVMWPDVPRLPCTTQCGACVGWIGQCLPRPPGPVVTRPLPHWGGVWPCTPSPTGGL